MSFCFSFGTSFSTQGYTCYVFCSGVQTSLTLISRATPAKRLTVWLAATG